jgi:hypothetical protein
MNCIDDFTTCPHFINLICENNFNHINRLFFSLQTIHLINETDIDTFCSIKGITKRKECPVSLYDQIEKNKDYSCDYVFKFLL